MSELDSAAADVLYKLTTKLAEDGDAILRAIDKLVWLEKSGVLDELIKLAERSLGLLNLQDELLDEESVEVAMKNIELLLTVALATDERTIKVVEKLVEAFKETEDFQPVGMVAALKALRDPDVQKALGFLLTFAKNFGKKL